MTNQAIVQRLSPARSRYLCWHLQLQSQSGRSRPSRQEPPEHPSSAQQQPSPEVAPYVPPAKEGFWGRVNPFARKVWVRKQTDPINNRLTELDQLNSQNARDIKDVDARARQASAGRRPRRMRPTRQPRPPALRHRMPAALHRKHRRTWIS